MRNVSYAEAELILADNELGSKYTVREIIDKKTIKFTIKFGGVGIFKKMPPGSRNPT
jgi:hypothetical protein